MDTNSHNSLRPPYIYWDTSSSMFVSLDEIEDVKKKRAELEKAHEGNEKIDIWKGIV